MRVLAGVMLVTLLAVGIMYVLLGAPGPAAGHPVAGRQDAPPNRPAPSASPTQQRPTPVVVEPEQLAREISGSNKPTVVCVGPKALYIGAHVPGALFHGAASTGEGLDDLKKWAKDLPRNANIVIYCGCCPLTQCPNIRPALMALRQMGFTQVRALRLPQDFHTDWIAKGFPIEK